MYGLFLSRFAKTMGRAERLAAERGGRVVGVDHITEALLLDSTIRAILRSCGADTPAKSDAGSALPEIGGGEGMVFTPGVRRVLEMAHYEAEAAGERHILAEHVLLALLEAAEEANQALAWFPYVGCVASQDERAALVELLQRTGDVSRVQDAVAELPRRTLLRASDGLDHGLLRPAAGAGAGENLVRPAELHDNTPDPTEGQSTEENGL